MQCVEHEKLFKHVLTTYEYSVIISTSKEINKRKTEISRKSLFQTIEQKIRLERISEKERVNYD